MASNTDDASAGARRRNRWSLAIWVGAALLLLVPAVAMQFTSEVDWTASDFVVLGAMLSVACGAYELAARITGNTLYRAAVGIAIATAFLTVWVNGAVGMLGSEDNPANLMFGGVLAVGFVGSAVARFRPRGMARALVATALAQTLVAVIAAVAGWGDIAVATVFFGALWLASAWLFRRATLESAAVGTPP